MIDVHATWLRLTINTADCLRLTGGAAASIVLSLDAPSPKTGTGTALVADGEDVVMMRGRERAFTSDHRWEHGVAGAVNARFNIVVWMVVGDGARRARGPRGEPGRSSGTALQEV